MKKLLILITALVLVACNCDKDSQSCLKEETKEVNKTTHLEPLYSYNVEEKIKEMGIELTDPEKSVANYLPSVRVGNLIFFSGKVPKDKEGNMIIGKLGKNMSIEQGYEAARSCAESQLSALKAEIGDLNKVVKIVKVNGFVNSTSDFTELPKVVNGFSDLMVEVFGERGKHARAAVGMASLPMGIACDIDMIVEVAD